jgi:hypothetical protein
MQNHLSVNPICLCAVLILYVKLMCHFSRLLIFEEMTFEYTVQHRGLSPEMEISCYCNISSPFYIVESVPSVLRALMLHLENLHLL